MANIHMIWLEDPCWLERLMSWSENFNLSEVLTNQGAADDYARKIYDPHIEYGIVPYRVEMTFAKFYNQAQQRGLWRPLLGRCDLCDDYTRCRKFEKCIVCLSCYAAVGVGVENT